MVQVVTVHLALPVDMFIADNLAAGLDARQVALSARSVLIEQQFGRTGLAHGLKHLSEGVAAGKEQQQYGNVGLGGMLHTSSGMMNTEWIFCFSFGGISM